MNINNQILYEDDEILVCKKEAGIAVQTARTSQMDMENALKNYLSAKAGRDKRIYLAVIHRLDQPVRGVLVFAKTPFAAKELNKQITNHTMGKYYLAEVDGKIPRDEDTLEDFLLKNAAGNTSKVVQEGTVGAKKAVLHYRKKEESLVEVELVTGRHHQIRVQLAAHGMPIRGDGKYNSKKETAVSLKLCAYRLILTHPRTNKQMEFLWKDEISTN